MKWITRERVKVDRVACPWLIRMFVDPNAEFLFVPKELVLEMAEREGAIPFDVPGVELGHHEEKCSFESIVSKYRIKDPAIHLLAKIVHGADVAQDVYGLLEAPGLRAIAEGFQYLGLKDDHEILEKEFIVYDALYAYCQQKVKGEKSNGSIHFAQTLHTSQSSGTVGDLSKGSLLYIFISQ